MEERTYTQQEVDELKQEFIVNRERTIEVLIQSQINQLQRIDAENQEKIKKAEKQAFREGIMQEEGYVQYLLKQARAYLQHELLELEEQENCAYWRSNGDVYMGDGWYDYQWAVAAALKQVKANEATVENTLFNGEGL
jgi:hydroxylamine reductase (hybrid-cluster protein)